MDTAETKLAPKLKYVGREKEYQREWAKNNPDKVKAKRAKYRATHLEKVTAYDKEYKRKWYQRNKEKQSAAWRVRYAANREEILTKAKARPVSDEERLRRKAYLKQWHQDNKSKVLVHRQRRAASGKHNKYHKKWRDKNRGRVNAYWHRHRALKKAATVNLKNIQEWIQTVKSKKTVACYYCQQPVPSDKIHFDHIIALSRGGSHSVENLCVSCQPCNNKKHSKSVHAFIVSGQQILSL